MPNITLHFASDNTEVSLKGNLSNPVTRLVRADLNEVSSGIELYAQTSEGYIASDVEVLIEDSTGVDKWRLSLTEEGLDTATWGAPVGLGTVGHGVLGRVNFWAQARAVDTELPLNDSSVWLRVEGEVNSVYD